MVMESSGDRVGYLFYNTLTQSSNYIQFKLCPSICPHIFAESERVSEADRQVNVVNLVSIMSRQIAFELAD